MATCPAHGPVAMVPAELVLQLGEVMSHVPLGVEPEPAVAPLRSQYMP